MKAMILQIKEIDLVFHNKKLKFLGSQAKFPPKLKLKIISKKIR